MRRRVVTVLLVCAVEISTDATAFDDEWFCRDDYIESGWCADSPCSSRQKKKPTTPTGTNVATLISRWTVPFSNQGIELLWLSNSVRRNRNVMEDMRYVRKPQL